MEPAAETEHSVCMGPAAYTWFSLQCSQDCWGPRSNCLENCAGRCVVRATSPAFRSRREVEAREGSEVWTNLNNFTRGRFLVWMHWSITDPDSISDMGQPCLSLRWCLRSQEPGTFFSAGETPGASGLEFQGWRTPSGLCQCPLTAGIRPLLHTTGSLVPALQP